MFNEKQFDELEDDEDYKKLLLASPEMSKEAKGRIEELPEEQVQETNNVEKYGEQFAKEEVYQEEEDERREMEDQVENNIAKYQAKGEELKEISITGVSAFKLEGKSVPEKERKQASIKPKGVKENKNAAKGPTVVQVANLSIMVN